MQKTPGLLTTNVFKFYLARVLGTCSKPNHDEQKSDNNPKCDEGKSGPLMLYCHEVRNLVREVLTLDCKLGPVGPYIPFFYENSLKVTCVK